MEEKIKRIEYFYMAKGTLTEPVTLSLNACSLCLKSP